MFKYKNILIKTKAKSIKENKNKIFLKYFSKQLTKNIVKNGKKKFKLKELIKFRIKQNLQKMIFFYLNLIKSTSISINYIISIIEY